jgi:purine-binding chemotaxis protein CheW
MKNKSKTKEQLIRELNKSHQQIVESKQWVVFTLDEQRYAFRLASVERIIRAVMVTPLPQAPNAILGIINLQGRIIPVFNIRSRFQLPQREIDPRDQIIIAQTAKRTVAVVVDEVSEVIEQARQKMIPLKDILPGVKFVEGVVKLEDGLILIHDLERFLSLEEEKDLDKALKRTSKEKTRGKN